MGYTTLRDETLPRLRRTLDALIAHTEDTKARTIAASQYVQSHKPHAAEMYHPEYQKSLAELTRYENRLTVHLDALVAINDRLLTDENFVQGFEKVASLDTLMGKSKGSSTEKAAIKEAMQRAESISNDIGALLGDLEFVIESTSFLDDDLSKCSLHVRIGKEEATMSLPDAFPHPSKETLSAALDVEAVGGPQNPPQYIDWKHDDDTNIRFKLVRPRSFLTVTTDTFLRAQVDIVPLLCSAAVHFTFQLEKQSRASLTVRVRRTPFPGESQPSTPLDCAQPFPSIALDCSLENAAVTPTITRKASSTGASARAAHARTSTPHDTSSSSLASTATAIVTTTHTPYQDPEVYDLSVEDALRLAKRIITGVFAHRNTIPELEAHRTLYAALLEHFQRRASQRALLIQRGASLETDQDQCRTEEVARQHLEYVRQVFDKFDGYSYRRRGTGKYTRLLRQLDEQSSVLRVLLDELQFADSERTAQGATTVQKKVTERFSARRVIKNESLQAFWVSQFGDEQRFVSYGTFLAALRAQFLPWLMGPSGGCNGSQSLASRVLQAYITRFQESGESADDGGTHDRMTVYQLAVKGNEDPSMNQVLSSFAQQLSSLDDVLMGQRSDDGSSAGSSGGAPGSRSSTLTSRTGEPLSEPEMLRVRHTVPTLVMLLKDDDPDIRSMASVALGRVGGEEAVGALLDMLEDPDRLVREAALLALARLKFAPAVPQIMYMYRTDIIRDVRQAATVALVGIGGAEAERALRRFGVIATELQSICSALGAEQRETLASLGIKL